MRKAKKGAECKEQCMGVEKGPSGLYSTCVIYAHGPLTTWQRGVDSGALTFFNKNNIKEGFKILKITKDRDPILNCPYIHIKKTKIFCCPGAQ